MIYLKKFENINFEDWDDEEIQKELDVRYLYNSTFICIKSYKNFIKGNEYNIHKIYGDPEGSYRKGQIHMGLEFVHYIEIDNIAFSYNGTKIYPSFNNYFKIKK